MNFAQKSISFYFPKQIDAVHISEKTLLLNNLVHELSIRDGSRESFIKSSAKKSHLALTRVQTIFPHYSEEVVPVQVTLLIGVDTCKSIMDGEGVTTGNFFLGQLDSFICQEMCFPNLEEHVTCLFSEVIFFWNLLDMNVFWFSLIHSMSIIRVFRCKRLAEIRVEHL